ncbi:MAG: GNAT family N-acetyltransferase [Gemmatimonadaceae bacterium]
MSAAIERVTEPSATVIRDLASLLLDAVDDNAGISFMKGLRNEEAVEWWGRTLKSATPRTVILVARDDSGVIGTVQLQPAWPPNQPHRADVAKLIVHRRARGRGIARSLMEELERLARELRFTLLLLDTCKGGAAEQLYTSMGWIRVGEVPRFALNPDGSACDTVFFYKELPAV